MNFRKPSYLSDLILTPLFGLIGAGLALLQGQRGDYAVAAAAYFAFASHLFLLQRGAMTINLPEGLSLQRVIYAVQHGIWFAAVTKFFDILNGMPAGELTFNWLIAFSVYGVISVIIARPTRPELASEFEAADESAHSKFQRNWLRAYPVLAPAFCVLMLSTQNMPFLTAILITAPAGWATTVKRKAPALHSAEWYAKNLGMPIMIALMIWMIFRLDL